MASSSNWQSSSDDEDWRNEDPNLLNCPELLCAAAAKLPPPKENEDGSFREAINMARELIVNNNVVLVKAKWNYFLEKMRNDESLSQQDEFQGTTEDANQALGNIGKVFETEDNKFKELLKKLVEMEIWKEEEENNIFNVCMAEDIAEWKTALSQLVGSYKTIQKYIPQEQLQNQEQVSTSDTEKSHLENIPLLVKELEGILNQFDSIKEHS